MEDAAADSQAEPEEGPPLDEEPHPTPEVKAEVIAHTAGGRRRGRRRVMKKKTAKDEEGYLGSYDSSILMVIFN
jgi:DNA polymerase delta subunit 3